MATLHRIRMDPFDFICDKTSVLCRINDHDYAAMAELVDALDSGSSRGNSVDVRLILAAFFLRDISHELSFQYIF